DERSRAGVSAGCSRDEEGDGEEDAAASERAALSDDDEEAWGARRASSTGRLGAGALSAWATTARPFSVCGDGGGTGGGIRSAGWAGKGMMSPPLVVRGSGDCGGVSRRDSGRAAGRPSTRGSGGAASLGPPFGRSPARASFTR